MAELITSAFARIGDKRKPPVTDATGAVNMDNGYTPNYEIDLSSGDPLAKAVERDVQNYLFWLLTDNVMQYQSLGFPEWSSSKPGGYSAGAYVSVFNNGSYSTYRSQTNNNTSNPIGSSTWDEIWTSSRLRGIVPMPLGGLNYISGGNLPAGSDVLSLTDGTYVVQTDAIAGQISNLPVAKAGVLEVKKYTNGGAASAMYRYNSVSNDTYWLNTGPGSSGAWNRGINNNEIGYTNGFIPRVQSAGFALLDNGNNYFRVGVHQQTDTKLAEVFVDSSAAQGAFVSGLAATYGGRNAYLGFIRGANNAAQDFRLQVGSSQKIVFSPNDLGNIDLWTNAFGINGNAPSIQFRTNASSGLSTIQATSAGELSIWTNSGTSAVFRSNGLIFNGTSAGEDKGLLKGAVEGGGWAAWKERAAALMVDIKNDGQAYSIFKATAWGTTHAVAFGISESVNSTSNSYYAVMNVGPNATYSFNEAGVFNSLKVQTDYINIGDNDSGLWKKADGSFSFVSNSVEVGWIDPNGIATSKLFYSANGLRSDGAIVLGASRPISQQLSIGVTPDTLNRSVSMYAWGNANSGGNRGAVIELSDSLSWMWYTQRLTNGDIESRLNGVAYSRAFVCDGTNAPTFQLNGIPSGSGGFANQLNTGAAFYTQIGTRPVADNTYFPLLKGQTGLANGYPVAWSFGIVTNGNPNGSFPKGCIHVATDNPASDVIWSFEAQTGAFLCPGSVYSGGAEFNANGNVRGATWGGAWLSDFLTNNFVSGVALGAPETTQAWRGPGYGDTLPYVITGVANPSGDEYIDNVTRRPMAVFIRGAWRSIGQY